MIVLDAHVLIAFLDADDGHHEASLSVLDQHAGDGYSANTLTVAEALVHPTAAGRHDPAVTALTEIGLEVLPLDAEDAPTLARVRARYRLRMPDAVVLHTALRNGASLATFDTALAKAAREAGITVEPASDGDEPGIREA